MPIIETDRMILEPLSARHLEALARLRSDPELMAYMKDGPETRAQTEATLAHYVGTWRERGFGMWALTDRTSGAFLGEGGLRVREDAEGIALRFVLTRDAWGRGLATELALAALDYAFSSAGLERVVAVAQKRNRAALRVLEKAGLELEREYQHQGAALALYAASATAWRPPAPRSSSS